MGDKPKQNNQISMRTYTTRHGKDKQNGGDLQTSMAVDEDRLSLINMEIKCSKMDEKLDKIMLSLSTVNDKFDSLETRQKDIERRLTEVEASLEFGHNEREDMKKTLESVPEVQDLVEGYRRLENKVEDLENRSRRNNFIIYNIPEDAEGETPCEDFMADLLENHMKIKTRPGAKYPIIIERAHRLGDKKRAQKPRPMIAKVLNWRDRQYIMKTAPAILKESKYRNNSLFVGDDVSANVRKQRKRLAEHMKKLRDDNQFACIPFAVPPVLLTKDKDGKLVRVFPKDLPKNP